MPDIDEQSQTLTPVSGHLSAGAHTVAPFRAPARGETARFDPDTNPLLWWLGRYQWVRGKPVSRVFWKHLLFGTSLMAIAITTTFINPSHFSLSDYTLMCLTLAGSHMMWISTRLHVDIHRWRVSSFLDELLLTALSPKEIASAIAQSASRSVAASFSGAYVLLTCFEVTHRFIVGRAVGAQPWEICAWLIAIPFYLLAVFGYPWVHLRFGWRSGPGRLLPPMLGFAWGFIPPIAGWFSRSSRLVFLIALPVLVLITLALTHHVSDRAAEIIAEKE